VWLLGRSGVCFVKVIRRNAVNPEGGGKIFSRNVGVAKRLPEFHTPFSLVGTMFVDICLEFVYLNRSSCTVYVLCVRVWKCSCTLNWPAHRPT
jgi:hypothetical protein